MAYVSQIHKGVSSQNPEQYRPVSLMTHIAKVFERVIKKKIDKYLTDNHKYNVGQFGFIKGRGTHQKLIKAFSALIIQISSYI